MFCFKCGKELTDEHVFCPYCGTRSVKNSALDVPVTSNALQPTDEVELNRDVMKNYLSNIRVLEFAKYRLNSDKANLEYRISSLAREAYISKEDSDTFRNCSLFFGVAFVLLLFLSRYASKAEDMDGLFALVLDLFAPVINVVTVIAGILTVISVFLFIIDLIKNQKEYNDAVKRNSARIYSETKEKAQLQKDLAVVNRDLRNTQNILDKAYSLDIIPDKYRGIGAIYFIHQNYSTSMMSFRDVLYHCDLDEISRKLSTIIEQQSRIIMELAYSNALNEQIIQQNNQILESAIRQEENLKRVEQYQQMSAVYSETTSQIQSYYFFKNGL